MFAPEVDQYINRLKSVPYRHVGNDCTYDAQSYELIEKIFEIIHCLKPVKYENRELWLRVPRGDISAFGSFEEWYDNGDVDSEDEFVAIWQDYYPDEFEWYNVVFGGENGYKAIFINNKMIIEDDPQKEKKSWPMDVSKFLAWLLQAVTETITDIKNGVYSNRLMTELPYFHRVGTICRKDYYALFPEYREDDFAGLTADEEKEFLSYVKEGRQQACLNSMTANDFFNYCAAGYKVNGYHIGNMSPKEQYKRFADGRDGGLSKIDPNSPDAFTAWLESDERMGAHPWEVCRGGNSTHVDLFVYREETGYSLTVRGSSIGRFAEAVRFYLALRRMDLPVRLYDAELLATRITGSELIGVVPRSVLPCYCESWFPEQKVIDYMHLPEEKRDAVIDLVSWAPLRLPILQD